MLLGILIGIVLGYFFKPQIDILVGKIIKLIKDNRRNKSDRDGYY